MQRDYNCLFSFERLEFCELNSKFYKVNLDRKTVEEIEFDELLVEYLVANNSKILKNFLMIYVRLCMRLYGVGVEYIKNKKDLDVVAELYLKEGVIDE